tara:strand:- start:24229 stop:25671 length:1443 start_codon:yes stop_codon:yes gene_type:complete
MDRRDLLRNVACGFGQLAFTGLAAKAGESTGDPRSRAPRSGAPRSGGILSASPARAFPARAKRVIFLFMHGGPSQVDTFDFKPELQQRTGQTASFDQTRSGQPETRTLFGSPWQFRRHGESGQYVSSLFPKMAEHVDRMCFIHSMRTTGTAHGQATLFMHTGSTNLVRPSMGSWICYGLGSESENLPGFVTIAPSANIGGTRIYSNAFLPAAYQGTAIGRAERPATEARFENMNSNRLPSDLRQRQAELLRSVNQLQTQSDAASSALSASLDSFEMAFRMQQHAPNITNLDDESESTLSMYGIGDKSTDDFGRQCLLARRLSESGVRFVQVNYSDNSTTPKWDQHRDLQVEHEAHAKAVDQPIAALLQDLQQRGLLDETLIWWCGEFGRTPFSENGTGRDHNPFGFTTWLAGGGVKGGYAHGATDELGMSAVQDRVHTHDLHATILHLLGLDHLQLTYRYAGRDFRLTDVAGEVVKEILA